MAPLAPQGKTPPPLRTSACKQVSRPVHHRIPNFVRAELTAKQVLRGCQRGVSPCVDVLKAIVFTKLGMSSQRP